MRWIKIFNSLEEAEAFLPVQQPKALQVENKAVCIVRTTTGMFALRDRCPHNGELLNKGRLNGYGEIICPWHGYRFQLSTGRECNQRSQDVETFPIRTEPDGIYLGM
jgi:nitrite reductase/ring-hydroxylating ferredoxin subunit